VGLAVSRPEKQPQIAQDEIGLLAIPTLMILERLRVSPYLSDLQDAILQLSGQPKAVGRESEIISIFW
jgi:hypothetical protein